MANCELLQGARDLAVQRGLPPSELNCPVLDICEGDFCVYLHNEDEADTVAIEQFYDRLAKHFALRGIIFQLDA